MTGLPSGRELQGIFLSEDNAIAYLVDHDILDLNVTCAYCNGPMVYKEKNYLLKCTKHNCRREKSILLALCIQMQNLILILFCTLVICG